MLTIYKLGFEYLNRKICGPWDVHKSHKSMQKIHKIIGMAKRIAEDDIYYKYAVLKQDYFKFIRKFEHLGFAAIIGANNDY